MTTDKLTEIILRIGSLVRSISSEDEDSQVNLNIIRQLCEDVEIDDRIQRANERMRQDVDKRRQESYERIEEIVKNDLT